MQRSPPPIALKSQKVTLKNSTLNSKTVHDEDELLCSDDEKTMEFIEAKSNQLEKPKFTQNDDVLSIVKQIHANQCTKDDLAAVKKSINDKFGGVTTELGSQKVRIDSMEERLLSVERQLATSAYENQLTKQHQIKNNINIYGIPKLENEDVYKMAIEVFKALGCVFSSSDFNAVYRLKPKVGKMSSIIVKFNDFDKKLSVLNTKVKKPVMLKDVVPGHEQSKYEIFVNNHLTPFFAKLMASGRQAVKNKLIHSCRISASGCMIKKKEDTESIVICSLEQMEQETGQPMAQAKKRLNRQLSVSPQIRSESKKPRGRRSSKSVK